MPLRNVVYGYKINGPQGFHEGHRFDNTVVLIDPYAKLIQGRKIFGDVKNKFSKFYGTYDFSSLPFDWGDNYTPPNIPEVKKNCNPLPFFINHFDFTFYFIIRIQLLLIFCRRILWYMKWMFGLLQLINLVEWKKIYVAATLVLLKRYWEFYIKNKKDKIINVSDIIVDVKIPHLLELGINAVELLPVFEFDEFEFQRRPNPRDHMVINLNFLKNRVILQKWSLGFLTFTMFCPRLK